MPDSGRCTTEGSKVLALQQTGKTLTVSMNRTCCDKAATMGTTGETMLLGLLVNTMLTFYHADKTYLNAEGNPLETEHDVYDYAVGFYE